MAELEGVGAKLLAKMGWKKGTGLGKKRDGPLHTLVARKRRHNLGIGAGKHTTADAWWDTMLRDAYGSNDNTSDPNSLFDACERRRCRPHGTAKLARLDAQDKQTKEKRDKQKQEVLCLDTDTNLRQNVVKLHKLNNTKTIRGAILKKRNKKNKKHKTQNATFKAE